MSFVFAGKGPLNGIIGEIKNIKNVGFQEGYNLEKLIREAAFSVYPSEWFENCPFSILESLMYGTPVLGANIGGIPELISSENMGALFEAKNVTELKNRILQMWEQEKKHRFSTKILTTEEYSMRLLRLIKGKGIDET